MDDDSDGNNIEYSDATWPSPWNRAALERNLRLQAEMMPSMRPLIVVDDTVFDSRSNKEGVAFHLEYPRDDDGPLERKKGVAFFNLNPENGLIQKAFVVKDDDKSGELGLKILNIASQIIRGTSRPSMPQPERTMDSSPVTLVPSKPSLPQQYFQAWNVRDMKKATSLFADNVEYDDTAFPRPFKGKDTLERHLQLCADVMPETFSFVLDDEVSNDADDKVIARWHVENEAEELPFTRGVSFYVSEESGKIVKGTDWKEVAVFKVGGISLFVQSLTSKLREDPTRWIPLAVWATYVYVVFFSDWFFGVPAQALEVRTWEEVRDLSLNFFLVSPILGLPFAPVVHPGLEGIFNLLLSWAAMFAGFLSDDRTKKPNLLPMPPTVLGMQFLTSAFLLPYLATRSAEREEGIYREDLSTVAAAAESRILPLALASVGTGSIVWAFLGRYDQFGGLQERFDSLQDLLIIDRVGSSFVVDLAIFALFQGWLVDDDMKRRKMNADSALAKVAKFVPFFGMALYLALRQPLTTQSEKKYPHM